MNKSNSYRKAYFSWRPWGYKLKILTSAWNLGGSVTPRYKSYPARKSIFSFRKVLREQGLFQNKYRKHLCLLTQSKKLMNFLNHGRTQ